MAKERMLTVLVPIKDSDATSVAELPVVNPDNINVIYKYNGSYYRVWLNPETGFYEYHEVVDREFPYLGKPLEIFDFAYDAIRMGTAPTISAQGVMWYAEKDENGQDVTLEDLWLERWQDCHVIFNGETFYLKLIPTSGKNNEDARYSYDLDFVSEIVVLESVYVYDVVQPYVTEKPVSENVTFSFFGDVNELCKRINASLLRSGLSSLVRKYVEKVWDGDTEVVPYVNYEQWNNIGLRFVIPQSLIEQVYVEERGNYNSYLQKYIFVNEDGDYAQNGYKVVLGKDKYGNNQTSEEKLVSFDKNYIQEALQEVKDTFELQYYITREKNSSGVFTGNTLIVIGDCEHDFADINAAGTDYVRDADGIPTTEHPFDYGVDEALILKEKTNTTEKIVTRITGVGSSENIPWYYPNPTGDGWIKPMFKINGVENTSIEVDYPESEGTTTADNVLYEKYLKNRIGDVFQYGIRKNSLSQVSYLPNVSYIGSESDGQGGSLPVLYLLYSIDVQSGYTSPVYFFNLSFMKDSGMTSFSVSLVDNTPTTVEVASYDSTQTYQNPTDFQQAFIDADGTVRLSLTAGHLYILVFTIHCSALPYSKLYDYEGYYYPTDTIPNPAQGGPDAYVPDGFYSELGLKKCADWNYTTALYASPIWAGYSLDGTVGKKVGARQRVLYKHYKDLNTGVIYKCMNNQVPAYKNSDNQHAYMQNAPMGLAEWVETYMRFNLWIWSIDGNWYKKSQQVNLADYGVTLGSMGGHTLDITDTIEFKRVKYITPCQSLMPEIYIKTDGERRYYDAIQYPRRGVVDTAAGEILVSTPGLSDYIINPIYQKDGSHYQFENVIMPSQPKEHIEDFEDIKPSIKGMTNYVHIAQQPDDWTTNYTAYYRKNNNGEYVQNSSSVWPDIETATTAVYALNRIDVAEEYGYDELDNDEIWEDNDDGNVSGEYKHPYFFVKLRPLGFNIFDLALQEDMVLSMTTGDCGACNFKIGVDENTGKNPVQIWEYNVYGGNSYATRGDKLYSAGDLRRYVDTSVLYYDTNGTELGYIPVDSYSGRTGFLTLNNTGSANFQRTIYTAEEVVKGEVGSLKQDPKNHFEGDVKVNGKFIPSQQDTSENFVWIALYKDTDTYGTVMPSARPDYSDGTYSVYIRPKSAKDVHTTTPTASTYGDDDDNADKFVLINIRMPQTYLRAAERELSEKLVEYMDDNNYQKFNFSINHSRIFLAQNESIDDNLNENSVVYVNFNRRVYRQYVQHYTYRMSHDVVLPEISVDMNEELSVSRTKAQRDKLQVSKQNITVSRTVSREVRDMGEKITRKTVSRNDDVMINGNFVSREGSTSVNEIAVQREEIDMLNNSRDLTREFIAQSNTFNTGVENRLSRIRQTVEGRMQSYIGATQGTGCPTYRYNFDSLTNEAELLWVNSDGTKNTYNAAMVCPTNEGMTDISWTEFKFE